jgi:hypothetical protein
MYAKNHFFENSFSFTINAIILTSYEISFKNGCKCKSIIELPKYLGKINYIIKWGSVEKISNFFNNLLV